MKKTPGTDGAWGLLCVATLRNENEQVQQPWQIRRFSNHSSFVVWKLAVQQPWQIGRFSNYFSLACHRMRFSNRDRSGGSQTLWGLHVGSQKYSSSFNYGAPGVVLPLAWQTSSDEGDKDSTIAPLCEEQENRDALSVSDENSNDEAVSKTDGEASADSETEGSNTASADDAGAKEEEASGDIVQEETAAA